MEITGKNNSHISNILMKTCSSVNRIFWLAESLLIRPKVIGLSRRISTSYKVMNSE
jgi:hypothetical protein